MQEQAIEAAAAIGLHRNSGLPEYTHMLLQAGRFDEARAAWARVQADEHDTEPQGLAREYVLDSLFAWLDDPPSAIAILRAGIARVRERGGDQGLLFLAIHLGRMGFRLRDSDAIAEAAAAANEYLAMNPTSRLVISLTRWIEAMADQRGEATAAREVATAAADLEDQGWMLLAANAYTDAALLADRLGLPERDEWRARADAIYEGSAAVSVLDELRSRSS
jgi:hypothetical protein